MLDPTFPVPDPTSSFTLNHSNMAFSIANIPDQTGRVAIVTGGTAGLGYESVIALARKGAHVIFTARNASRGQEALDKVKAELAPAPFKVEFAVADNTDLKSVEEFAESFLARNLPLHILLLNAGVAMKPYGVIEGVESTLFNNQVAHQYLAIRFLPLLERSGPSRVVVVSSDAHAFAKKIDLELPTEAEYSSFASYSESKLANNLLAHGLLQMADSSKVYINIVHPGIVVTDIFKTGVHFPHFPWLVRPVVEWLFGAFCYLAGSTPLKGALTQLYVATSPDIEKNEWQGQYFTPIAKLTKATDLSRDPQQVDRVWKWTNDVIACVLDTQQ
ncbi:unnamed protein product [Aphanomyces euteiches]|uniref:Uncharacterized protein n=1 Tax=Aphanomyces euteiches TaxID=100861 RepID=A0A6G0WRF6_9STRA|nr:hypothetical protein Ae201684_012475 [Aphanomyces euteiches]KAF0729989.1 hypothetical protein Ae201684_012478 [Aphanomyces euteiches]KAH9090489.1 hypothetical protein Ae201684P_014290 [Aphanomyces euteiches]KAH9090495.1 hypothetical protein Ae201684P_014296 [Aphanomyces euteiches]KAH9150149.1 hypothetical protein AeRB84_006963 [Aphanomyces euteiches]